LSGIEAKMQKYGVVPFALGIGYYQWLGASKVQAMREAEHPEETDWEEGLVDLEEHLYGNVLDDSSEWFDPLDPY